MPEIEENEKLVSMSRAMTGVHDSALSLVPHTLSPSDCLHEQEFLSFSKHSFWLQRRFPLLTHKLAGAKRTKTRHISLSLTTGQPLIRRLTTT